MEELERTSTRGFRAALLYPTVDGEMVVDLPVMDPLYAKIAELEWPIFLHGAGLAKTQRSNGSKMEEQGRVRRPFRRRDIGVRVTYDRQRRFDRYPDLRIVIRSSGGGLLCFCIAFLET